MLWHQAWEVHYFQIHLGRIRRSNCDIDTDRVWCERPITLTQYAQVHFNTASISHYTEIRKETLEEETAASTVSSVVWNVSEALFLLHSHISLTVNLCTDFPCQILSSFLPLHPCCREFSKFLLFLFVFFWRRRSFLCFSLFLSPFPSIIPFFAVTLHRLLCM